MKKSDRNLVFNKYGGRCAYCGELLVKGWHVDEIEPVIRKKRWVGSRYVHKVTGEELPNEFNLNVDFSEYEHHNGKWVPDGYEHPHRLHVDNQNPACASCNINKHSMDLESFRSLIAGFMKHLNNISTQYKIAKRYGLITEIDKPVVFYFETVQT